MESELLLYDLSVNNLKQHGFVVNPYGSYIGKSTVEVKQCKIAWYVDEKKVLHVDEHVNTRMVEVV